MTAIKVLNHVLRAGGRVVYDSASPRLLVPQDLKPIVRKHREALRLLVAESYALAAAYQRYWGTMLESQSLDTLRASYREIARLERKVPPEIAWYTLREAAGTYYEQSGICPFCQEQGSLHLPAERINEELPAQGIESADVCKN